MKRVRGRGKKAEVFFPQKTSYKLGTGVKGGEQVGFLIAKFFSKKLKRGIPD